MKRQCWFAAKFKMRVVREARQGEHHVQEMAVQSQGHPNQVSIWTRQAVEDLGAVCAGGAGVLGA